MSRAISVRTCFADSEIFLEMANSIGYIGREANRDNCRVCGVCKHPVGPQGPVFR